MAPHNFYVSHPIPETAVWSISRQQYKRNQASLFHNPTTLSLTKKQEKPTLNELFLEISTPLSPIIIPFLVYYSRIIENTALAWTTQYAIYALGIYALGIYALGIRNAFPGCGFEIGFVWVCFFGLGKGVFSHNRLLNKNLCSFWLFGNWVCFLEYLWHKLRIMFVYLGLLTWDGAYWRYVRELAPKGQANRGVL